MEITVKEAAKKLGLHPSRVRQLITEGKLPAKRPGKRLLLIKESDLELLQTNLGYSTVNKLPNIKIDDLFDVIQSQNFKIENLEKELIKVKEKVLFFEQNYSSHQQTNSSQVEETTTETSPKRLEPTKSQKSISTQRLEWLKANQEKYAGKYLAFDQEKLISFASTYKEAKENAVNLGISKPFVVHVPDPNLVYHINW
jgi:excisionase family DNA binding protein